MAKPIIPVNYRMTSQASITAPVASIDMNRKFLSGKVTNFN